MSYRGRQHPAEWQFALSCFALFTIGCIVWALLMFGSDASIPIVHAGSLGLVVLALSGGVAGLWCTLPILASIVLGMRLRLSLILYLPVYPPAPDAGYTGFAAILTVGSLVDFAVLLVRSRASVAE